MKKYPSSKTVLLYKKGNVLNVVNESLQINEMFTIESFRKNDKLNYIGQEIRVSDNKYYDKNVIFPIKRDCVFEGKYFAVPNDSDSFLKDKYGDYMVLPKPEHRHWHAKRIEV